MSGTLLVLVDAASNMAVVAQKLYAATSVMDNRNSKYRRFLHLLLSGRISRQSLFVAFFKLSGVLLLGVERGFTSRFELLFRNIVIFDDECCRSGGGSQSLLEMIWVKKAQRLFLICSSPMERFGAIPKEDRSGSNAKECGRRTFSLYELVCLLQAEEIWLFRFATRLTVDFRSGQTGAWKSRIRKICNPERDSAATNHRKSRSKTFFLFPVFCCPKERCPNSTKGLSADLIAQRNSVRKDTNREESYIDPLSIHIQWLPSTHRAS